MDLQIAFEQSDIALWANSSAFILDLWKGHECTVYQYVDISAEGTGQWDIRAYCTLHDRRPIVFIESP